MIPLRLNLDNGIVIVTKGKDRLYYKLPSGMTGIDFIKFKRKYKKELKEYQDNDIEIINE